MFGPNGSFVGSNGPLTKNDIKPKHSSHHCRSISSVISKHQPGTFLIQPWRHVLFIFTSRAFILFKHLLPETFLVFICGIFWYWSHWLKILKWKWFETWFCFVRFVLCLMLIWWVWIRVIGVWFWKIVRV